MMGWLVWLDKSFDVRPILTEWQRVTRELNFLHEMENMLPVGKQMLASARCRARSPVRALCTDKSLS